MIPTKKEAASALVTTEWNCMVAQPDKNSAVMTPNVPVWRDSRRKERRISSAYSRSH